MDTPISNLIVGRAVQWREQRFDYDLEGIPHRGIVLAFELSKDNPPRFQLLIELKQVGAMGGRWATASHGILMTVSALACYFPTLEPNTEVKTDDTFRKEAKSET